MLTKLSSYSNLLRVDLHPGGEVAAAGHAEHGDGYVGGGEAQGRVQDVGGHGVGVRAAGHLGLPNRGLGSLEQNMIFS